MASTAKPPSLPMGEAEAAVTSDVILATSSDLISEPDRLPSGEELIATANDYNPRDDPDGCRDIVHVLLPSDVDPVDANDDSNTDADTNVDDNSQPLLSIEGVTDPGKRDKKQTSRRLHKRLISVVKSVSFRRSKSGIPSPSLDFEVSQRIGSVMKSQDDNIPAIVTIRAVSSSDTADRETTFFSSDEGGEPMETIPPSHLKDPARSMPKKRGANLRTNAFVLTSSVLMSVFSCKKGKKGYDIQDGPKGIEEEESFDIGTGIATGFMEGCCKAMGEDGSGGATEAFSRSGDNSEASILGLETAETCKITVKEGSGGGVEAVSGNCDGSRASTLGDGDRANDNNPAETEGAIEKDAQVGPKIEESQTFFNEDQLMDWICNFASLDNLCGLSSQLEFNDDLDDHELYTSIEECQWENALAILGGGGDYGRSLAGKWRVCKDDTGENTGLIKWRIAPLHAACMFGAPKELIEMLLQLSPEIIAETDDRGNLPLHLAFLTGMDQERMMLLVQAYPEAMSCKNNFGRTPIQCITIEMLQTDDLDNYFYLQRESELTETKRILGKKRKKLHTTMTTLERRLDGLNEMLKRKERDMREEETLSEIKSLILEEQYVQAKLQGTEKEITRSRSEYKEGVLLAAAANSELHRIREEITENFLTEARFEAETCEF